MSIYNLCRGLRRGLRRGIAQGGIAQGGIVHCVYFTVGTLAQSNL